jgi:hypothetical protein
MAEGFEAPRVLGFGQAFGASVDCKVVRQELMGLEERGSVSPGLPRTLTRGPVKI